MAPRLAQRSAASIEGRKADAAAGGLYARVWSHLKAKGLTAPSGDRDGVRLDMQRVQRRAERKTRVASHVTLAEYGFCGPAADSNGLS